MSTRRMLLGAILCVLISMPVVAEDEISVAVMDFASKGGVTQKQMDALGDMLANEIRDMGNFRVIGKSDIHAALDLESQKRLLGCDDASCIAEVGGALGARWVVVGNVSKFGELYLLNLKLLDVEKIRVMKGVSKKVSGGEALLIDALSVAAKELIEGGMAEAKVEVKPKEKPLAETKTTLPVVPPTPPPPRVEASAPSSTMKTIRQVTFWSGVGLTTLGAVFMTLAILESNQYYDTNNETRTRLDSLDMTRTYTGLMWAGFGSGVALATAGLVMWLLEPSEGAGATAVAAPTPDGQGLVFSVGGRW